MSSDYHPVACVIGAGPYGLSIAAHLRCRGVRHRIFGKILRRWRDQMPKGMYLKSEGFASSLSEPSGQCTLERYCTKENLPYGDRGVPVSRQVFVDYAMSFQREYAPHVEEKMVIAIDLARDGFDVTLENGEELKTSTVIVATGMDPVLPAELEKLPRELCSHAVDHYDLSKFKGKVVAIIGAGQSALETAALLLEEGASPIVLAREAPLVWNETPNMRPSLFERFRYPLSPLGEGLKAWVYHNYPGLFRYLPQSKRFDILKTTNGPAGAWWLKEKLLGQLPVHFGSIVEAAPQGDGVAIKFSMPDGRTSQLTADHIIAGTGYRFDIDKLQFLSPSLKSALQTEGRLPLLSRNFESSVPGLYFAGLASTHSFGPTMRFVCGTGYAADRISAHVARSHNSTSIAQVRDRSFEEESANINIKEY